MKLLQILYPGLGGHSSVAFSLIEGASALDARHHLLGYGIEQPSAMFVAKATELGVPFESVVKNRGVGFSSQVKVWRALRRIKPDSVILHSTNLIFVLYIYALFYKVTWLSVEHQSNSAKSKKDWVCSFFILLLAPKIVYLTESYLQEIKRRFGRWAGCRNIRIIPNGINTDKFQPSAKHTMGSPVICSMISRLTPLRDHQTLIQAFAKFSNKHKAHLFIAGEGTTLPLLTNLVAKLELQSHVTFTGALTEEDVIALLRKTDIYIHSSLAENLSTSMLQAMACEIPIVATDIPGINNLLSDNIDGLLFPAGDVSQLLNCMLTLMNNKQVCNLLTANAIEKVKRHYNHKLLLSRYLEN